MPTEEICRYTRTYSPLEGLQRAHTVSYMAAASARGTILEIAIETEGETARRRAVLCPRAGGEYIARTALYLCENGVGPDQLPDVLADLGIDCLPVEHTMA